MTEATVIATAPKGKHQQTELSTQVRALLTEGRTVEEIMAITGTKRHIVGLIKYHMERQANQRISKVTGKPVRRYIKRKKVKAKAKPAATKAVTPGVEMRYDPVLGKTAPFVLVAESYVSALERLNAKLREKLRERPKAEVKIQYIEVEVPQPFSHFTFWQRLRILFLGREA